MIRFLLVLILLPVTLYSQFDDYPRPNHGIVAGGFGLNWIDGELFYSFGFRPEISFANFGVGLNLKIDVNKEGNIRKENFNEFSDYMSIIRYIRYGIKDDPLYVKLGALDYHTIGHGSTEYEVRRRKSTKYGEEKYGERRGKSTEYGGEKVRSTEYEVRRRKSTEYGEEKVRSTEKKKYGVRSTEKKKYGVRSTEKIKYKVLRGENCIFVH